MADNIPSSVSNPSGSATKVSREILGWKCFRIWSRQLSIPSLHPQESDWLKFRQHQFSLAQFFSPRHFLFGQSFQPMLTDFGQANAVQRFSSNMECITSLL